MTYRLIAAKGLLSVVLALVTLVAISPAAQAVSITAPIGVTNGHAGITFAFVSGSDGNVWLNTNYTGPFAWQSLTPLNVAYGVGATSPGLNPAAYAVGTDGNLYIIHQVGSAWNTVNIGTPPGVALLKPVGVISNTSSQPFVFLIGSDGNLWLAHNAGSWGWTNLHTPSGVAISMAVGAVNIGSSYPQIFIVGSDGNLWRASWNGSSYPWVNAGTPGAGIGIAKGLYACADPLTSSAPEGWVLATDNTVRFAEWNGSGFNWYNLGVPPGGSPVATVGISLVDADPVLTTGGGNYLDYAPYDDVRGSYGAWYSIDLATVSGGPLTSMTPVGTDDPGYWTTGPVPFLIGSNGDLYVLYGTGDLASSPVAHNLGTPP